MGLAGKSPLGSAVRAAGLGEGQSQAGGLEAVGQAPPPRIAANSVEAAAFSPGRKPDEELLLSPQFFLGEVGKACLEFTCRAAWGEGPSKSPQTQLSDSVKPAGGQYL